MKEGEGDTVNTVRATITANEIVDLVTDNDGLRLAEITERLDLSKSTVHRHVKTLESIGYLEKEGHQYKPGFRLFEYASKARESFPIFDLVTDEADRLAEITSESVEVYFERNGQLFEVYRSGQRGDEIGVPAPPLRSTAPGRTVLAQYEPDEVDRFDEGAFGDEETREQLHDVRTRRLAVERDEAGVTRVASPVCTQGDPVAILCVAGPSDRISGQRLHEDIAELLRSSTKTIEWDLLSA